VRGRGHDRGLGASLGGESASVRALYLRPAISLLALASVAVHSTFPFGFTLPVALTQDWSLGVDAAIVAGVVAAVGLPVRFPAPRTRAVLFTTFLVYAFITPEWARRWEG